MYSEKNGDTVSLVFENFDDMLAFGQLLDDAKYYCDSKRARDIAKLVSKTVTPQFLIQARQSFHLRMAAKGRPRFVNGEKQ
jgi:hypothetical protein